MILKYGSDPIHFKRMNTDEVRENFLLQSLFVPAQCSLYYSDLDRAIIGGMVPTTSPLTLPAGKEIAADYFCQQRELGVLNVGAKGNITVKDKSYTLDYLDGMYIGRENRDIKFASEKADKPAQFYLLSYPAHKIYPIELIHKHDAEVSQLGSGNESNERVLHKYIHPRGVQSCQLVMGVTELAQGSVWNTMPVHTHARRMEVYMYFDLKKEAVVFHLMGEPGETRHIVVRNQEAVLSPSWSIHSGCGTSNYSFVWGMGGENQEFDDMDSVAMKDLA